jgi:hypothetical protein
MKQAVDEVVFGNPSFEQITLVQSATEFDFLLPEIFKTVCPINTSTLVQDELKVLVEYQKDFKSLSESKIKRFTYYDYNLSNVVINFLKNYEIDATEMVEEIINMTKPLLLKIKYKYQRPRPYQLAYYYKDSLFPRKSSSADTPSFPSGHTFQMNLIQETIGSIYPNTYADLCKLTNEINEQRLYYGLHYASDLDFAKECAELIVKTKIWTSKFQI